MLKLTVWGEPMVQVTVTVADTAPVPVVIEPLVGLTDTVKSNG